MVRALLRTSVNRDWRDSVRDQSLVDILHLKLLHVSVEQVVCSMLESLPVFSGHC